MERRTPDVTDQVEAFMAPLPDKAGDWKRWYRTAIAEATRLYVEYLRETGQQE